MPCRLQTYGCRLFGGIFLTLPVIIFFSYTYITGTILPRSHAPVIETATFKNFDDFKPEYNDQIVKVRGNLKQGIAKCGLWGKKDREDFPYGTVVVELANGKVEIMIQAKKPSQVLDLESESKRGGIIEGIRKDQQTSESRKENALWD